MIFHGAVVRRRPLRVLGHTRRTVLLHLGAARVTALVPLAPWAALVAVIALFAVIAGLRLGQPQ